MLKSLVIGVEIVITGRGLDCVRMFRSSCVVINGMSSASDNCYSHAGVRTGGHSSPKVTVDVKRSTRLK